jgi:hypothetical protein
LSEHALHEARKIKEVISKQCQAWKYHGNESGKKKQRQAEKLISEGTERLEVLLSSGQVVNALPVQALLQSVNKLLKDCRHELELKLTKFWQVHFMSQIRQQLHRDRPVHRLT